MSISYECVFINLTLNSSNLLLPLFIYFGFLDPTQKDRQGNDVGTQYRGGIYYHSLEQKMVRAYVYVIRFFNQRAV